MTAPESNNKGEAPRGPGRLVTDPFALIGRKVITWIDNLGASTIFLSRAFL